ncbi:hypothetical protein JOM56_013457 [Amanita muscaria]
MSDSLNGLAYNGQQFFNCSTNSSILQNGQGGHAMGPDTRFTSKFATNHVEPQGIMYNNSNQYIMANATHDELLRSGNGVYLDLFLRCKELEKDLTIAEMQADHWRTSYERLSEHTTSIRQYTASASPPPALLQKPIFDFNKPSSASDMLREKQQFLQALFPGDSTDIKLNRSQYPLVKFWTRSSWTGGSRTSYMEDENGIVVPDSRIREIREHIAQKFNEVKRHRRDLLAKSWTYADMELRQAFYRNLRNTFLEFALCDDNWKAKSMISIWYSDHFQKTQVGDNVTVKTEATTSTTKEEKGKRRQSVDESALPSKKPKFTHGELPSLRNPLIDLTINRPNSPPPIIEEISITSAAAVPSDSSNAMSDAHQPTSAETTASVSETPQLEDHNPPVTLIDPNASLSFDATAPPPVPPQIVERLEGESTEKTQEHSTQATSKKTTKRAAPNRKKTVSSSKTARNLCAKEWLKLPGHLGMVTEFDAYWEGLGADGQKHWDEKKGNTRKLVLKVGKVGTGSGNAEGAGNEQK